MHQGLSLLLYEQLPGRFPSDPNTKGWIAYAEGDLTTAAARFAEAIAADSIKNRWTRLVRASALVSVGQADPALAEMQALLRQLRREDESTLVRFYESKELVLYGIGMLNAARGRTNQAREDFKQALAENLGFAPPHRALANLARGRGEVADAVSEMTQAVELDDADPVLHYELGTALLAAGRKEDGLRQLRRVIAMEPWWAEPYSTLAQALERAGKPSADALAVYRMFVARAPKDSSLLPGALERIRVLSAP